MSPIYFLCAYFRNTRFAVYDILNKPLNEIEQYFMHLLLCYLLGLYISDNEKTSIFFYLHTDICIYTCFHPCVHAQVEKMASLLKCLDIKTSERQHCLTIIHSAQSSQSNFPFISVHGIRFGYCPEARPNTTVYVRTAMPQEKHGKWFTVFM